MFRREQTRLRRVVTSASYCQNHVENTGKPPLLWVAERSIQRLNAFERRFVPRLLWGCCIRLNHRTPPVSYGVGRSTVSINLRDCVRNGAGRNKKVSTHHGIQRFGFVPITDP